MIVSFVSEGKQSNRKCAKTRNFICTGSGVIKIQLFAPEVGVTAQKWPHFARVSPFEESRWSVAEWIFAGFSTLPMEALVVVFMD